MSISPEFLQWVTAANLDDVIKAQHKIMQRDEKIAKRIGRQHAMYYTHKAASCVAAMHIEILQHIQQMLPNKDDIIVNGNDPERTFSEALNDLATVAGNTLGPYCYEFKQRLQNSTFVARDVLYNIFKTYNADNGREQQPAPATTKLQIRQFEILVMRAIMTTLATQGINDAISDRIDTQEARNYTPLAMQHAADQHKIQLMQLLNLDRTLEDLHNVSLEDDIRDAQALIESGESTDTPASDPVAQKNDENEVTSTTLAEAEAKPLDKAKHQANCTIL